MEKKKSNNNSVYRSAYEVIKNFSNDEIIKSFDKKTLREIISNWAIYKDYIMVDNDSFLSFSNIGRPVKIYTRGPFLKVYLEDGGKAYYCSHKYYDNITSKSFNIKFRNETLRTQAMLELQMNYVNNIRLDEVNRSDLGLEKIFFRDAIAIKVSFYKELFEVKIVTKEVFEDFALNFIKLTKKQLETILSLDNKTFNFLLNIRVPKYSTVKEEVTLFLKLLQNNKNKILSNIKKSEEFISKNNLFEKNYHVVKNFIICIGEQFFLNLAHLNFIKKIITECYPEMESYLYNFNCQDIIESEEEKTIIRDYIINFVDVIDDSIIDKQQDKILISYLIAKHNIIRYFAEKTENDLNIQNKSVYDYIVNNYDKKSTSIDLIKLAYLTMYREDSSKTLEENLEQIKKLVENIKNNLIKKRLQDTDNNYKYINIDDLDLMSGVEFEEFISNLFCKMGYDSKTTKTSGDQGIDVIVKKDNQKIGIQCKRYSGNISNSAIQEAIAGKSFYRLDNVIVITNSFFTKSAISLAEANDVILWDRIILKEKINENQIINNK